MSDQKRLTNGEYTFKEHGAPEIAPLAPSGRDRELGIAARQLADARVKQHRISEEVAELALYQVALTALDTFPEAASIRLEPEYDTSGMMVTAVLDTDGNALAEAYGFEVSTESYLPFNDWQDRAGIASLTELLPVQDSSWFQHAESEDSESSNGYIVDLRLVEENGAKVSA